MINARSMKAIFTIAVVLMALMSSAASAATPIGKVVSVIGAVDVFHDSGAAAQPLLQNDVVFLNDRVVTGLGSQAKLLLRDDSILKIGQSSELLIDKQIVNAGAETQTRVKLLKGRLRSVIGRKLGPLSSYEVHTKVAVTGVRGTDFEVWVRSLTETAVRAFQGEVEVRNLVWGIVGSVLVTPNTFTVIRQGAPPQAPVPIPPGKSLGEQLGGDQAAGEQELDQAEEQQIQERDLGESSEAGSHVTTELELVTGIGGPAVTGTANVKEIVDNAVIGDITSGQVDTVTQTVDPGGVQVPIKIEIPRP